MFEPRKVAIIGGAGFIGTHFVRRLSEARRLHSILDIRPPAVSPGPDIGVVVGDVRDEESVLEALRGADAVLHLAAAHHDFGIDRSTFFSVNEGGARTLCSAMDALGIRTVCFYSTVAVYGSPAEPPGEESPCLPDSPYGESKLAGEEVFRAWADQGGGRQVLIIRPTVTFGPGNFANMYTLIRQIASRAYVSVGSGTNRKSLVYVDNIVHATLELWSRPGRDAFDVYNAVDKPDLTSAEIARRIYEGLGRRAPRFRIPLGLALAAAAVPDAVISVTGWNLPVSSARVRKFADSNTVFRADRLAAAGIDPPVPLATGIERMVEWYLTTGRDLPLDRSIPPAEFAPFRGVEQSSGVR